MNNQDVANSFVNGTSARNGRGNYTTDGKNLWSYAMLIGRTLADGTKQVLYLYAPNNVSVTTTRHCSYALRAGAKAVTPVLRDPATGWSSSYAHWSRLDFPEDATKQSA